MDVCVILCGLTTVLAAPSVFCHDQDFIFFLLWLSKFQHMDILHCSLSFGCYLYCFCVGLFHGAAVNTYVQGFLWTYVFILLSRPESSITRPHGTSHFNFLENGWYVSQSSYTTLEFPLSTGSNFSISSTTFFCYFLKF